jgi:uracil-DNA glycosylase
MNEDQLAQRAMKQILKGWISAGVDFMPPANPSGTDSVQAASVEIRQFAPTKADLSKAVSDQSHNKPEQVPDEMRRPAKQFPVTIPQVEATPIWPDTRPQIAEDRMFELNLLNKEVIGCVRCKELAQCRTQTVFGVGNVKPRLCFFGEAPGADEDKQGEPFVGRAGQLLDKIIEAMTLKRSDVYILNTLKCRPPSNRTPLLEEVENCRPFFTRQLEILRPELVVCLGACAAQALLQTKESIGKLRGRIHDYRGVKVYATYHPAYLLRNPPAKRDVWEDMKLVMKEMGLKIPKTKDD